MLDWRFFCDFTDGFEVQFACFGWFSPFIFEDSKFWCPRRRSHSSSAAGTPACQEDPTKASRRPVHTWWLCGIRIHSPVWEFLVVSSFVSFDSLEWLVLPSRHSGDRGQRTDVLDPIFYTIL
jgi:hypothetical protein